jgi:hypothetical protein
LSVNSISILIRRINIYATLQQPSIEGPKHRQQGIINSSASSNFIWPSIAKKAGLIPKKVKKTFFTFNNQPFITCQAYKIDYEVINSLGKTKVTTQIFYAADVKGYLMVFSMSYLQSQGCGYYNFANNQ